MFRLCVVCKATLRDKREFVQGIEKGVKTYSPSPLAITQVTLEIGRGRRVAQ